MSDQAAAPLERTILCDTSFVSFAQADTSGEWRASWPAQIRERLEQAILVVSAFTIAEVRKGHLMAGWGERRRAASEAHLQSYPLIGLDMEIVDVWASLTAQLDRAGSTMKVMDSWIAATALSRDIPLVSTDGDFDVVPDLEHLKLPIPQRRRA